MTRFPLRIVIAAILLFGLAVPTAALHRQDFSERSVPLIETVTSLDTPAETTILHYRGLNYDVPLDEAIFSLRRLCR